MQGMMLSRVMVDLEKGGLRRPGHAYIAISRIASFHGLFLAGFNKDVFRPHKHVERFVKTLQPAPKEIFKSKPKWETWLQKQTVLPIHNALDDPVPDDYEIMESSSVSSSSTDSADNNDDDAKSKPAGSTDSKSNKTKPDKRIVKKQIKKQQQTMRQQKEIELLDSLVPKFESVSGAGDDDRLLM